MTISDEQQQQHAREKVGIPEALGRFPGWQVVLGTELAPGGETVIWGHQVIIVDRSAPELPWRIAHAVAHLTLHLEAVRLGAYFTEDQERQADLLADVWLDRVVWSTTEVS